MNQNGDSKGRPAALTSRVKVLLLTVLVLYVLETLLHDGNL